MVSSDFLGFGGSLSDKLEKWGSLVTNRTNIGGLWVTNGKMVTNGKKVECPPPPLGCLHCDVCRRGGYNWVPTNVHT